MGIEMLLDMAADAYGDRVALGPADGGVSYAALRRAATGAACRITESASATMVFVGVNGIVHPLSLFAAAYAGVPYVPLNYRLAPDALAELIGQLDDPLVVCDDQYVGSLAEVGARLHASSGWLDAALHVDAAEDGAPAGEDDAAAILFTSGTTSAPKGVVLSHANLTSYVLQTVEFASADPVDAALISVPPYHIAGVGAVLTNVFSGRRMLYLPDFTAAGWLQTTARENVTTAMLVPTMLARIVEHLDGADAQAPTLRTLSYGGARMPRPVLEAALRSFPDTGFVNAYGLTETSSTIAVLDADDHRAALSATDPAIALRLGSAGRLVTGVEAQIRDGDRVCGPGEVGELWVRGPQVTGAYLRTESVLDPEGWFPTRDRTWFDADGYLFIEGRSDDTIIRGGENIAPAEIEDVMRQHDGVADVAVFGAPDDEWGERIVAVVVTHGPAASVDDLRAFVRSRLRGSRTPDDVLFADALPYTATGKLLRNQLRLETSGRDQ